MQLVYLSRGTATIELLAGAGPAPQERFTELGGSFGQDVCTTSAWPSTTSTPVLAELAERGVPLIGEPFAVEEIGRRLAFLEDNCGNLIERSAPR